jgi:Domain of unknown function (DUF4386)
VNSTQKTARVAGTLCLVSAAAAGVPLIYIPRALIVEGNATMTAHNILASEMIFRGCIVSELIGAVVFIFMVRALFRLTERSEQDPCVSDGDVGFGLGPHHLPECVE